MKSTSEGNVKRWLKIEEDIEIRKALVENALEIVKNRDASIQALDAGSCRSNKEDCVVSSLPAESTTRFHFKKI